MTIKIRTGNAAFHAGPEATHYEEDQAMAAELRRIFGKICDDIEQHGATMGSVMDINGNRVGEWTLD